MGAKDAKALNRLELAEYLTNLSEQLRRGVLETRGRQWTIPEDLDFRMEFKEKKGRLVAKLSLQNCMTACHREFKPRGGKAK